MSWRPLRARTNSPPRLRRAPANVLRVEPQKALWCVFVSVPPSVYSLVCVCVFVSSLNNASPRALQPSCSSTGKLRCRYCELPASPAAPGPVVTTEASLTRAHTQRQVMFPHWHQPHQPPPPYKIYLKPRFHSQKLFCFSFIARPTFSD